MPIMSPLQRWCGLSILNPPCNTIIALNSYYFNIIIPGTLLGLGVSYEHFHGTPCIFIIWNRQQVRHHRPDDNEDCLLLQPLFDMFRLSTIPVNIPAYQIIIIIIFIILDLSFISLFAIIILLCSSRRRNYEVHECSALVCIIHNVAVVVVVYIYTPWVRTAKK